MLTVINLARAAASSWGSVYNAYPSLQTGVTFAHLGGMLASGGVAIAADRSMLRVPDDRLARIRALGDLSAVHLIVLVGLTITVASGVLMLAADLDTLLRSPVLWLKLLLLVALLGNGFRMTRAERALRGEVSNEAGWAALRRRARTSLVLWFAVVLTGTMLMNAS